MGREERSTYIDRAVGPAAGQPHVAEVGGGPRVARVAAGRARQRFGRRSEVAQRALRAGQVDQRHVVHGIRVERAGQDVHGGLPALQAHEHGALGRKHEGTVRRHRQRGIAGRERLLSTAGVHQCVGKITSHLEIVGRDFQTGTVDGDRFCEMATLLQERSEVRQCTR